MEVRKSDGSFEEYSANKVKSGIYAAYKKMKQEYDEEVGNSIVAKLELFDKISTDEIRSQVEEFLMDFNKKVAKAYIRYGENEAFIKDREKYMEDYVNQSDENAASLSETDPNANQALKNVATLEGEVYKTQNRNAQRRRMKDKLKTLFPEVADQYKKDLEDSIIYAHDEASTPALKYYCQAVSLYPLLSKGVGNIDGVTPSAPNDLQSFGGQVTNLVFLLSAQCKGAVALGEYQIALVYYTRMEYGKDWLNHVNEQINTIGLKQKTIRSEIRKSVKQFIYGINQPASNRNNNSPFTNISIYDKTYYEALFKDFYYPDGTQCTWEEVDYVQRLILELRRELNLIKPLTFPVTTIAMVNDGHDIIDKNYKQLCAEEWSKGSSHFCYNSNNPSSLASCCFSKDQKVLWKSSTKGVQLTTLEELYNIKWEPDKKNLRIFHNGSWVSGKPIELENRKLYRVLTENNKEFFMTDNHINVTLDGEKTTDALTESDYLMFNTISLNAIPENDEHLTYEQGFAVGAFLGDGSFGAEIKGTVYEINYSQNEAKYSDTVKYVDLANKQLGGEYQCRLGKVYNNVYPVKISSKELAAFIMRWTNWKRGTYAFNKELNLDCLLQSVEFRKGILDGWYNTDGGNSNRCYTTSPRLAECMEVLITSLGLQSIIDVSDRTGEGEVVIRGVEYNRNYPLYCVRWYTPANHRKNKDIGNTWIKKNNSIYFKVKSIEEVEYSDKVYCIECKNEDEPYFTLPSGLITHNCRVLNEITENTFSSVNGLQGIMTGSCNVITVNLNRIVQKFIREKHADLIGEDGIVSGHILTNEEQDEFRIYFSEILERVYKYHIAYKTMLYEQEDKKMFASSNGGYIYMRKLYSTVGLIGYQEAAMFMGLDISKNDDYINFLNLLLSTVKEQNKIHSIHDKKKPFLFNSEAIPGENLAVKFYQKDKKDGYYVPKDRNLFASYFFNPWDDKISVLDKMYLHGECTSKSTDGGQACHINLMEDLSVEQYEKLIDYSTKEKTTYWTINRPISTCPDCGYVHNGPIDVCPKCGCTEMDWWTRIIGYLRPLSSFSKERFKEAKRRVYSGKDCIDGRD